MSRLHTPKRGGVVVPTKLKWHQKAASAALYALANVFMSTWRVQWHDPALKDGSGPVIFCVWHNRLALSMRIYHGYAMSARPANGLAALISASKDGAFLADVLQRFGVQAVRGSSSRRGQQALLECTTWAERGYHVAITPDGPRGPKYHVQNGVVALAQLTGLPIVPLSIDVEPKISLRSWDRFQIPLPFAKCIVRFGEPIAVPREASDEEREKLRMKLEQTMKSLTVD